MPREKSKKTIRERISLDGRGDARPHSNFNSPNSTALSREEGIISRWPFLSFHFWFVPEFDLVVTHKLPEELVYRQDHPRKKSLGNTVASTSHLGHAQAGHNPLQLASDFITHSLVGVTVALVDKQDHFFSPFSFPFLNRHILACGTRPHHQAGQGPSIIRKIKRSRSKLL